MNYRSTLCTGYEGELGHAGIGKPLTFELQCIQQLEQENHQFKMDCDILREMPSPSLSQA
jgi:hypothetical protein